MIKRDLRFGRILSVLRGCSDWYDYNWCCKVLYYSGRYLVNYCDC